MSRKYCLHKKNSEEQLLLLCEWDSCSETFNKMHKFLDHIKIHVGYVVVQRQKDCHDILCLWRECDYVSFRPIDDMMRHIFFHAFHVKIKCSGSNMIVKANLQNCKIDNQSRNVIPELPMQLICGWSYCGRVDNNPEDFYRHVEQHAANFTYTKGVPVKCDWEGCGSMLPTKFKLRDHLRTHTQEKVVACPTCGALFSNKTKFFDHLNRQADNLEECFQCSYCDKKFPTERLLRDHLRHHVNNYKCPYCDMTCPNQSTIQHHIVYRHSDNRPYECETCHKGFKGLADLRRHSEIHNTTLMFRCHVEKCEFQSKTYYSMAKHFKMKHQNCDVPRYLCHICGTIMNDGHTLTKHLKVTHNFKWPSGHKRFRYKIHEDGFARLQLVRYESCVLSPATDKTGLGKQGFTATKTTEESEEQTDQETHTKKVKKKEPPCSLDILGDVALNSESYASNTVLERKTVTVFGNKVEFMVKSTEPRPIQPRPTEPRPIRPRPTGPQPTEPIHSLHHLDEVIEECLQDQSSGEQITESHPAAEYMYYDPDGSYDEDQVQQLQDQLMIRLNGYSEENYSTDHPHAEFGETGASIGKFDDRNKSDDDIDIDYVKKSKKRTRKSVEQLVAVADVEQKNVLYNSLLDNHNYNLSLKIPKTEEQKPTEFAYDNDIGLSAKQSTCASVERCSPETGAANSSSNSTPVAKRSRRKPLSPQKRVLSSHKIANFMIEISSENTEAQPCEFGLYGHTAAQNVEFASPYSSQHPSPMKEKKFAAMNVVDLSLNGPFNSVKALEALRERYSPYDAAMLKQNLDESNVVCNPESEQNSDPMVAISTAHKNNDY